MNLTRSAASEGWPSWSPDGNTLLFSSDRSGTFSVYAMNADGSGLRQLTHPTPPLVDARANFSPNQSEIVFNRKEGGSIAVYVLKFDRQSPGGLTREDGA